MSEGMRLLMQDVSAFHAACDIPIRNHCGLVQGRIELRRNILREEARETDDALRNGDLEGVADGLADIIYVAIGTALEFGIPLDRVWSEVQRANMAKRDPLTGKVRKREDGKVLKPEGWTPPNIAQALRPEMEWRSLSPGARVRNRGSDYRFEGVIVTRFAKVQSGAVRYVVENDDGILHIFSANNLEPITPERTKK